MLTVDYDLLDLRPGHQLLDAGCGAGRHAFAGHRRGAEVYAMDYDLAECKKVLFSFTASDQDPDSPRRGGWHMVRGDVLCLPFAEASFDRIICAEVCEHLHEDFRVLEALNRLLKPRGRIAITVPTFFSEWLYGKIEPFYFQNPGGHVRIFTPGELATKIRAAGLSIYAVRHAHGFHTPYWLLRCIFGLANEKHPLVRSYRQFLEWQMLSPFLNRFERRVLDWVCPKSVIFYAWKR
jgi:SAM-dependent methyltransferase